MATETLSDFLNFLDQSGVKTKVSPTKRGGLKISPTLCASNMPTRPLHAKYAAGAF
jgi:hypothetical protein